MANNKIKILPSIASANQLKIKDECDRINGTKYLHIDIEDGNFLPNITFGLKTIKSIMSFNQFSYDIHLLVTNPLDYLDDLINLNPSAICFHIEAAPYPLMGLNKIKKANIKAGLALNFKTSLDELAPFIDSLDYIIIMCAEPDNEGDQFNPHILNKIREAKQKFGDSLEIWVDGGVSEFNLPELQKEGACGFVMGRAVWNKENPKEFIETLIS